MAECEVESMERTAASSGAGGRPGAGVRRSAARGGARARAGRVIAVGGGKGGIGKSMVSASLATALARRGSRVVVLDADLGGANLHTCLGVAQPARSLSDFVGRRVERLEELLVPTGVDRLALISGALDTLDAANLKHGQKAKLMRHLRGLDADYVVLDLGAGTSFNVLDFFLTADVGIAVLLPEPTSIENAYRFIKAACFRRLSLAADDDEISALVADALAQRGDGSVRSPWELVQRLRERSLHAAMILEQALSSYRPLVLVNQARSRVDYDVGPTMVSAWRKFFGLELGYLGTVPHDETVWQAVRGRRPLLSTYPEAPASAALARVAESLVSIAT